MCKCECNRFGSILALCAADQNGDYFLRWQRTSEEGSSGASVQKMVATDGYFGG